MYLPRSLISLLYTNLRLVVHAQSPPVILLVALEPDALCACRILTALFKRDYIPHHILPVSGYGDLLRASEQHVHPLHRARGGAGGYVVCVGLGGLIDLGPLLGMDVEADPDEGQLGGIQAWVLDARRPWNLGNVFNGMTRPDKPRRQHQRLSVAEREAQLEVDYGEIQRNFGPGKGGVIVYDDGDIKEELQAEREAYYGMKEMPILDSDAESDGSESDGSDGSTNAPPSVFVQTQGRKRRSSEVNGDEDSDNERPRRRQRSGSTSSDSVDLPSMTNHSRPGRRGLLSTNTNGAARSMTGAIPPSHQSSSDPPDLPTSYQPPPPDPDAERRTARRNRRRLRRLKARYRSTIMSYYGRGTTYAEPVSSLAYALAAELGEESNDHLWMALVGVSSLELYGRTAAGIGLVPLDANDGDFGSAGGSERIWGGGERVLAVLRDEVRRLNPPTALDAAPRGVPRAADHEDAVMPTTARGPHDRAIRLSPEPRFLLVRHWSLYDSMRHSPYLAARLQLWSERGAGRLDKFLAVMGISLDQSRQRYTYMSLEVKRSLRNKLLQFGARSGLPGVVPPGPQGGRGREGYGFVRCWGWTACLSAQDVAVVVGAILEVGDGMARAASKDGNTNGHVRNGEEEADGPVDEDGRQESDELQSRFHKAYAALGDPTVLKNHIEPTQELHRAILRTGTQLLTKGQIRRLQPFRMAVLYDGPDIALFRHPSALTKLALWVAAAVAEQIRSSPKAQQANGHMAGGERLPLVLAALNERRGCFVVVGTGSGGVVLPKGTKKAEEVRAKKEARKAQKMQEKEKKKLARKEARRRKRGADAEDEDDERESESEPDTETESSDGAGEDSDDPAALEYVNDSVSGRKGVRTNKFGLAFQAVVEETGARVRTDSFEHSVVEVKRDDLNTFLEALNRRSCVG